MTSLRLFLNRFVIQRECHKAFPKDPVWARMIVVTALVSVFLAIPSALAAGGTATVTLKTGANIDSAVITNAKAPKDGSVYTVTPGTTYIVQVTRKYTQEELRWKTGFGGVVFNQDGRMPNWVEPDDLGQTFTLNNIEAGEDYVIDLSSSGNKDLVVSPSSSGTGQIPEVGPVFFGAAQFPVPLRPVTVVNSAGSASSGAASAAASAPTSAEDTGETTGNPGDSTTETAAAKPDNPQANLGLCIPTLSGAKCTVDNYQDYLRTLFYGAQIIASVLAVVMIVYGGIQYIISQGDTAKTGEAKEIIIGALTGIALLILSNIFLQFLFTKVAT